ncbi:hypothetical protein DL766_008791 [Monosporascus sp. MC13-8B]|uniref:C2H2-type domain-containing protein n=1 Tax=Monosporascus cannonballus TaxID=155416 RepID=A0ABY0GZ60_9PEZI|nr:hypothetical protein DL762_007433 [Monosporascus cannonballus]RYO83459.1 hypothetical protein DL763_007868 [Monosporascus cannonballus]RYP17941.1 hypothetical protein DL766_008791 [Monosporascus sp. MC13-8B]
MDYLNSYSRCQCGLYVRNSYADAHRVSAMHRDSMPGMPATPCDWKPGPWSVLRVLHEPSVRTDKVTQSQLLDHMDSMNGDDEDEDDEGGSEFENEYRDKGDEAEGKRKEGEDYKGSVMGVLMDEEDYLSDISLSTVSEDWASIGAAALRGEMPDGPTLSGS